MPLATGAALDALVTMVTGVTGMQRVYKGVPESLSNTVDAYITVGGHTIDSEEFGENRRDTHFWVVFGYRVHGAEATAEDTLADYIDAFEAAFFTARHGGTGLFDHATTGVEDGLLDASVADSGDYLAFAGQEFRTWPYLVTVVQRAADA